MIEMLLTSTLADINIPSKSSLSVKRAVKSLQGLPSHLQLKAVSLGIAKMKRLQVFGLRMQG